MIHSIELYQINLHYYFKKEKKFRDLKWEACSVSLYEKE